MPAKSKKPRTCPVCGWKLANDEQACSQCGKVFTKDGKKRGPSKIGPHKPTKIPCPSCGAMVSKRVRKCPTCKAAMPVAPGKVVIQPVEPEKAEEQAKLEEPVAPSEPVRPVETAPTVVTEEKAPETTLPAVPEPVVEAQPIPQPQEPVQELPAPVPDAAGEVARPSDISEAGGQEDAEKKPPVSADLAKTMPQVPEGAPLPEPQGVQPALEPGSPSPPAEAEAPSPGRTRKLKSAKVTTVPVTEATKTPGRTNGISLVNGQGKTVGRGMVNGTGAVSETSFVNGTGISNGIGPKRAKAPVRRKRRLSGTQAVVVILALIVVISGFMFMSGREEPGRYSINGDFSDWADATIYRTMTPSISPSSNITRWAVASEGSDLFLYFETEEPMMNSSEPESYYLFADADGLNSTGYVMESIGADYMLQLTGWNGTVKSSPAYRYSSQSDHFDWNAWTKIASLSHSKEGSQIEARASLPITISNSSRFVLLSKDSMERGSVSYAAPLSGAVLLVEQIPSTDVEFDGLVSRSIYVEMLTLRFTSEGGSGIVDQVNLQVEGATLTAPLESFSLASNETRTVIVSLDTSSCAYGQLVSAGIISSGIISSYRSIDVSGVPANAYVGLPPAEIVIDGAFADWEGRLSPDIDSLPVACPNLDIEATGNVSNSEGSFFYVSVEGNMCDGTYVPAFVVRPSGSGGGGGTVIQRKSAEDILRVFIDNDRSVLSGQLVTLDSKQIGADQMVEVKGIFGRITSANEFSYSSWGTWELMTAEIEAAKDSKRMEIGVTVASLQGSSDIDFIVETTSWRGRSDSATFDPSSETASMMTWIVDSTTTSPYATSMSYQRKMFYDGVNYWSFFFDGANTVHKYSIDEGKTWANSGAVFKTQGVDETSIWYDPSNKLVYIVGDTAAATTRVLVQVGLVDAAAHMIYWGLGDSSLTTSSYPLGGKNTYICKDTNGYLWVLSSNCSSDKPLRYWLNAFKSRNVNDPSSWVETGQMLPWYVTVDNVKGSIVPAGSGSDVWAVYIYGGYVSARKYNGTWQADQRIYTLFGSTANTDNSPPSVVVDKKGVVHVVHGTGLRVGGGASTPEIMYSHNNTDLTTFTTGVNLDPGVPKGIGGYYPTISLDTSTGDLYVLWLQNVLGDATYAPRTVMGRKCVSGTWSNLTIVPQTNFVKGFMTSIYSVSGEYKICWQWTQNVTTPIDVMFDGTMIPEFADLTAPMVGLLCVIAVLSRRPRSRSGAS